MTKPIRSNKGKGIKVKSQKDSNFEKLKLLSKYIISGGNQRILDVILRGDAQSLNNMKYRTISQLAMYPKLISYINTYMNSLFDFNAISPAEWFYSIMIICKLYGLNSTNHLNYSKYQQSDRDDFIKTITDYYVETGSNKPNKSELNAFYILYKHGLIKEDILISMKEVVSGKSKTADNSTLQQNQFSIQTEMMELATSTGPKIVRNTFDSLSSDIRVFLNNVNAYIGSRNVCKQCEVNCRTAVSIDTNAQSIQPVDLMFSGFMPNTQDTFNRLPFSGGDSSKLFHRFLQPLVTKYNLKYVLTNLIFCSLDKTKQLQNPRKTVKDCAQLLDEITRQFNPKLKVIVGAEAAKAIGLKGGISKLNGKLSDNIFVVMDPETVIVNNSKLKAYEEGWIQLEQHIATHKTTLTTTIEIDDFNIPEHQIIKTLTNDLTLFDVKPIKDKVIIIMLDKHGVKKYLIQPIQVPIYIKSGSYKECINFSSDMNGIIFCSEQERQLLNSKLYREINKCEGL